MLPDVDEEDAGPLSGNEWQVHDTASLADSGKSDTELDDPNGEDGGSSQPIQKRRRVTRACDECRRKKIKCDGKQPCTHCSVYSYECTYDKPSNRRRNPAPQYIEALEGRLQRAEALLRKFIPDVDLADPNLDPSIQQEFHNREQVRAESSKLHINHMPDPEANDTQLTSMIDSIGQLDLDDKGGWDFHGVSSGAVFLRRMKEHFRGMLGPVSKAPFLPRPERPLGLMNLDSPEPIGNSPFSSASNYPELPPKDVARRLCYYSLSCATCLVRIIHIPSFYEKFDRIYERPLDSLDTEETHFLGLVYAVLALGCMYNNLDETVSDNVAYKVAIDEGLKYYKTARALLQDITDCRDVTSLQALLFMILFLQATSNLSGCYAFVGIALRSALRIGLHRNLQHEKIGVVEQEVRRRVFYVIRQMDIYVSTMLGFPLLLNSEDTDQPFPAEIDDEFITPGGLLPPAPGTPSFFEAFNAHSRLMEILSKITKFVYPMKGLDQSVMRGDTPSSTYLISYARIKEIEADLHNWYERLPETWRPSPDGPIEVVRVRHLLRFAYAHVQLVLYRPFLHYVSPRLSQGNKVDELSYACAAAAISVSRNIVHIGLEIRKQRVLSGPYWFMLYTEFFAVLSLVFYAVENPEKPGSTEVLADARAGRQMIADLADKSLAADRVTTALKVLFDQLPDKFDQARARQVPSKKRSAAAAKSGTGPMHHGPVAPGMSAQRSQDLMRGRMASGPFGTPNSQGSLDAIPHSSEPAFGDSNFTGSPYDFIPMDMSSRATPESTSTRASSHPHPYPSQAFAARGAHHPVHKLDSLMFPSEDPFAYPNQPMMELGFQPKTESTSITMANPSQEAAFFFPGSLDDMGDHMMGQPPPYMVPHQQQHAQGGMGMAPNMFDPSGMMPMHPAHAQQQRRTSQHSGQSMPQQRRARTDRNHERQIEQMFTEQGMQPDWGSFFGSGRGGFQGM